jgi:hypothetical protein
VQDSGKERRTVQERKYWFKTLYDRTGQFWRYFITNPKNYKGVRFCFLTYIARLLFILRGVIEGLCRMDNFPENLCTSPFKGSHLIILLSALTHIDRPLKEARVTFIVQQRRFAGVT